jgi:translation initiation factor IF-3
MELLGTIKYLSEIQKFNSGFKKRELVIITEEQYPQNLLIEFIQEKINLLDKVKIGDKVKVAINLRGREWINPEGKIRYFNSIQGWRIEKILSQNLNAISEEKNTYKNDLNDLPF